MNDLLSLAFDGAPVRVIVVDHVLYFVAKDVALQLGYADAANAIKQHAKGVAKYHPLATPGGTQAVRVLAEPDVWRLIVGSKRPEAQRFERWLFEEALPQIRRTGFCQARSDVIGVLLNPRKASGQLIALTARVSTLQAANVALASKASALARLEQEADSVVPTDAAKLLSCSPGALLKWLAREHWVYRRTPNGPLIPSQRRITSGHLRYRLRVGRTSATRDAASGQIMITPKGCVLLAQLLPDQTAL